MHEQHLFSLSWKLLITDSRLIVKRGFIPKRTFVKKKVLFSLLFKLRTRTSFATRCDYISINICKPKAIKQSTGLVSALTFNRNANFVEFSWTFIFMFSGNACTSSLLSVDAKDGEGSLRREMLLDLYEKRLTDGNTFPRGFDDPQKQFHSTERERKEIIQSVILRTIKLRVIWSRLLTLC